MMLLTSTLAAIGSLGVLASAAPGDVARSSVDIDAFVTAERSIALQGVLNNIGANGSLADGAAAGFVVASPSKANPDCKSIISLFCLIVNTHHEADFYTWTRDSALTLKMIVDEFLLGATELQPYIEDYLHAQAVLQTVTNPSGTLLPSGKGLGEPKYNVDGTRYNGNWGRPQRDGPALRAIALITYSNWLVANGQVARAKTVVWPIISNDLSYVGQYWYVSFRSFVRESMLIYQGILLALICGKRCLGPVSSPFKISIEHWWRAQHLRALLA